MHDLIPKLFRVVFRQNSAAVLQTPKYDVPPKYSNINSDEYSHLDRRTAVSIFHDRFASDDATEDNRRLAQH